MSENDKTTGLGFESIYQFQFTSTKQPPIIEKPLFLNSPLENSGNSENISDGSHLLCSDHLPAIIDQDEYQSRLNFFLEGDNLLLNQKFFYEPHPPVNNDKERLNPLNIFLFFSTAVPKLQGTP